MKVKYYIRWNIPKLHISSKHTIVDGFIILMKFIFVVEQVYDDNKKCFKRFMGRKYVIGISDMIITCRKDLWCVVIVSF